MTRFPGFTHLVRMTDDTGLFEHARHAIPRRQHGYCTDDVARGLVVTSREPDPSAAVVRLAECYLAFLTHAQGPDGAFRNRLGYNRRWIDEPALGDWWGRALWGLGTAATRSPVDWIRTEALTAFHLGAIKRSPSPRAMAFAGLGAAEVLRGRPDYAAASLLDDAVAVIGPVKDTADWQWPYPSLTYANPALAEVLLLAGDRHGDDELIDTGLRMLAWLRDVQMRDGRLSVIATSGWHRGGPRTQYDQQPIEVAALADACATAAAVTGDGRWRSTVHRAGAWFHGDNDQGVAMWDTGTGGGYDGLTATGPNLNQGAESTLAFLSTWQHLR